MLKAFFKALNVRPDERKPVSLLLGKGFFLGIFLASYQVSAETLFLNRMVEYLKEAIVISGILGVCSTALFAYLQERVKFAHLAMGNLLLIFFFTLGIFLGFKISPDSRVEDFLTFFMFTMIGPILAVVLLSFWGTFGRLFDLRQSKRIIGQIDVGQLIASIATYFVIPFLTRLIPDTSNYLLISAIGILVSLGFLIVLDKTTVSQGSIKNTAEERKETSYKKLSSSQFVRQLSLFLFFSMITFTFIQYSYQNVVAQQFPDETSLRNFVSIFTGSILILGLLMQTFVNDKVITEYGLKVALLILPIILAVFTIASLLTGIFFGYKEGSEYFTYFFLFIALSRLFNFSIRDSLENPTVKLYFAPFDINIRFNIQTKVEGVVNEASRLLAGLLILGLSYLTFIDLLDFSFVVMALLVGYIWVVSRLYNGYKRMIRVKLERQQQSISPDIELSMTDQLIVRLNKFLRHTLTGYTLFSFKLLEKIHPQVLPHTINVLMNHKHEKIRDYAQVRMNELRGTSVSDHYVLQTTVPDKSKKIIGRDDLLELFKTGEISRARVYTLSKSESEEDRQYAAEIIGNYSDEERTHYLVDLLYDPTRKVRQTAIKTSQKKYNVEVFGALIANLADKSFSGMASNALTAIGEPALSFLEASFYKNANNTTLALKIIQIMGRIGGETVQDLLWNKLDYPNKVVVSEVLVALGQGGFRAGITQISRIKYVIESDIEAIAWNMAAFDEVSEVYFGKYIKVALEQEIEHDIRHIYMLLSMLYDARSIQLVKENIESATSEGMTYAIELLDVFLSDELKKKIIPVLDDLTYFEKARKLEEFYPREPLSDRMVLKFLLNRDFTQTNRYTKACVIYQIGKMKLNEFTNDLIAHFFNPDQMIREVACWAVFQIDEAVYHKNINRIPDYQQKNIFSLVEESDNELYGQLLFNKLHFLKESEIFYGVDGVVIAELCDLLTSEILDKDECLSDKADFYSSFYIIGSGMIQIHKNDQPVKLLNTGEFIGESLPDNKGKYFLAVKDRTTLYKIDKEIFYDWLSENVSLANQLAGRIYQMNDKLPIS